MGFRYISYNEIEPEEAKYNLVGLDSGTYFVPLFEGDVASGNKRERPTIAFRQIREIYSEERGTGYLTVSVKNPKTLEQISLQMAKDAMEDE
ncbi:Uncharacterised protein [uncultured archaeon]|nr:Uncharacterised protein [uncultured archaeon]